MYFNGSFLPDREFLHALCVCINISMVDIFLNVGDGPRREGSVAGMLQQLVDGF